MFTGDSQSSSQICVEYKLSELTGCSTPSSAQSSIADGSFRHLDTDVSRHNVQIDTNGP
jgi:hypothetical protein